ncbi:MAG TPA: 16S rRNA (cytosine(967)-C(5))-methyltransferase, partial [Clostridiales bacterium]|nr:16S rRNA (cytosine(967)-C(5))-methyltransferase [Clostridiales bacterium]
YSTCTLNPEENENITDAFLQNHTDFVRIRDIYPHTIFPDASHDGFFIDVFTKRN